ncbi:hypothetical protein TNCV_4575661 [Trichonephila clavipes]|nr:hypothetical protein TNCV_4575661 [Trichonephila clavipes]
MFTYKLFTNDVMRPKQLQPSSEIHHETSGKHEREQEGEDTPRDCQQQLCHLSSGSIQLSPSVKRFTSEYYEQYLCYDRGRLFPEEREKKVNHDVRMDLIKKTPTTKRGGRTYPKARNALSKQSAGGARGRTQERKRDDRRQRIKAVRNHPRTQKKVLSRGRRSCGECSEEVGEKGLLESRSPTFRIDSSEKDMRRTGFEGPGESQTIKTCSGSHCVIILFPLLELWQSPIWYSDAYCCHTVWGGIKPNRNVTCMVLNDTANHRRTSGEFRGPRSDTVSRVALSTTTSKP